MGVRNWLVKKASKTAETVVMQTKEALQKNMEHRVVRKGDLYFTLGKLALLGLMVWLTGKEAGGHSEKHADTPVFTQPTAITINNYLNERRQEHD